MPVLESSSRSLDAAWQTAVEDLASLPLGLEDGPAVPIAGLPLYQQFFGRDSLTIGWQSLLATKSLLRDSLLANAAWQGTRIDDFRDEEPGKMIHQARWGPTSALGLNPFDISMLQGRGRHNPDLLPENPNAPGGVCNGITSGFNDEHDIDFMPPPHDKNQEQNWRWAEQWLPHAAWYLYAVALGD